MLKPALYCRFFLLGVSCPLHKDNNFFIFTFYVMVINLYVIMSCFYVIRSIFLCYKEWGRFLRRNLEIKSGLKLRNVSEMEPNTV